MNKEIYTFVNELLETTGAKAKQDILTKYTGDETIQQFVKRIVDPLYVYGIQKRKLENHFNKYSEEDLQDVKDLQGKPLSELFDYLEKNNTGREEDLKVVIKYIKGEDTEYHDLLMKAVTKQLKLGVTAKTVNKVWGNDFIFLVEVMRSKSYEKEGHKLAGKEVIATIKMDGIRMIVTKKDEDIVATSRSGKLLKGYEHILDEMKDLPNGLYDGELVYTNKEGLKAVEVRQKTSSIANTKDGDRSELKLVLFDMDTGEGKTYKERREELIQLTEGLTNISYVEKVYEGNDFEAHRVDLMKEVLGRGEEGLMVALSDGLYEKKQTDKLQKVKPSYTIDLRVHDIYEGLTYNTSHLLGGVIVSYKGHPLKVGNGWTKEQQEYYIKYPEEIIGKIIEIEHNGESKNKQGGLSVNFPRVVGVREDKDEESYD